MEDLNITIGASKNRKVVIIGDLFLDILPSIFKGNKNRVLNDGESFVDRVTFQRGGCAGNFAAVLSSLMPEDQVIFISKVGNDVNGDFLISQLHSYGIDARIKKCENKDFGTAITIAVAYEDGERHFITYNGAMETFSIEDIDFSILKDADHISWRGIWFTPKILHNSETMFKKIREEGRKDLTISMDLGFDPYWGDSTLGEPDNATAVQKRKNSALKALKYVDFLFGNSQEICNLCDVCDISEEGLTDFDHAIRILFENGIGNVIVHKGSKGALIFKDSSDFTHIKPQKVEKILNPVGSGDTFDAAFIYKYLKTNDVIKSAEFASKAAAYSLSHSAGTKINEDNF